LRLDSGTEKLQDLILEAGGEREVPLSVQKYLQKAELCENLAVRATDAIVGAALTEAARQWRRRARLLAQHEEDTNTGERRSATDEESSSDRNGSVQPEGAAVRSRIRQHLRVVLERARRPHSHTLER
jgi:hypothetical protein